MGTLFDKIIDLGLVTINDYKLTKLYNLSEMDFIEFCDGLLMRAIPNFTRCKQSLEYDTATRSFVNTLTPLEESILADLWAIEWFTRNVQNSSQIELKLQNSSSARNHSSAQNLKEKSSYLVKLKELVDLKMTNYQLTDLDYIPI